MRAKTRLPLYHTPAHFVNRHFAQKLKEKNPKICATFQLAILPTMPYNKYIIKKGEHKNELGKTNEKYI